MKWSTPRGLLAALAMLAATSHAQLVVDAPAPDAMRETQLEWSRSPRSALGQGAVQEPPQTVVDEGAPQQWSILMKDKTLYRALSRWAAQAQYQLIWQIDRDFPIESGVVFEGGVRGAVTEVMSVVALTDFPLQANFNTAARVLRVARFMDEGRR
jgi:hypothetical protein